MKRSKPWQLLIADDDSAFRDVLKSVFDPWFELLEAVSGEQAVEIVEGHRVDLIVLDMHMEELTGIETIQIVKRIDAALPCILETADATEDLRRQAVDADAWSVLSKPVGRRELLTSVSTAIDSTYGDPDLFLQFSAN